jgi:hypothetical protein
VRVQWRVQRLRYRVRELLWWGGRWGLLVCWLGRREYCLYEDIMLKTDWRVDGLAI